MEAKKVEVAYLYLGQEERSPPKGNEPVRRE